MQDPDAPSAENVPRTAEVAPPTRTPWQFGLGSLILLIATIAVWMALQANHRQNAILEARIKAMQPLAHELLIDDNTKIAVVKRDELWFDDNDWEIYLPPGSYRLCLATREIDNKGFPGVFQTASLQAGRHHVGLKQASGDKSRQITITRDSKEVLAVEEPKEWDPATGSEGGGQFATSTQHDPGKPVVLFRRRFMGPRDANGSSRTPPGPTNGILLWIEPTAPALNAPAPAP